MGGGKWKIFDTKIMLKFLNLKFHHNLFLFSAIKTFLCAIKYYCLFQDLTQIFEAQLISSSSVPPPVLMLLDENKFLKQSTSFLNLCFCLSLGGV